MIGGTDESPRKAGAPPTLPLKPMTSPLHTQGGESAPTPTPWKVQGNFIGGEVAAIVEMAQSSLTTYEEKRANLALIVQAVNERPALLAQAAHHSAQLEKSLGRIEELEEAARAASQDLSFLRAWLSPRLEAHQKANIDDTLAKVSRALLHPDSTKKY